MHSIQYIGPIQSPRNMQYERIIAGEPMPETQRRVWQVKTGAENTGSQGFLDFRLKQSHCSDDTNKNPGLYVAWLGVEPEHEGRGIASQLIGELEEIAAQRGISRVIFTVFSDSARMLRLAEHLGYEQRADLEPIAWRELVGEELAGPIYFEKQINPQDDI